MSETRSVADVTPAEPVSRTRRKVLLGGLAGVGGLGLGLAHTEPAHAVTTDELDVRVKVLEQPWLPSGEDVLVYAQLAGDTQIRLKKPLRLGLRGITNVVINPETSTTEIKRINTISGDGKTAYFDAPLSYTHWGDERVLFTHHGAANSEWWGVSGRAQNDGTKLAGALYHCHDRASGGPYFHASEVWLPKGHVGTTTPILVPHEMSLVGYGPNYVGSRIFTMPGFPAGQNIAVVQQLDANTHQPIPYTTAPPEMARAHLRGFNVDCMGMAGVNGIMGSWQQQGEVRLVKVEDCEGDYALCMHNGQDAYLQNMMFIRCKRAIEIRGQSIVKFDKLNIEDGTGTEDILIQRGGANQSGNRPSSITIEDLHAEPRGTTQRCIDAKDVRGLRITGGHVSIPERAWTFLRSGQVERTHGKIEGVQFSNLRSDVEVLEELSLPKTVMANNATVLPDGYAYGIDIGRP